MWRHLAAVDTRYFVDGVLSTKLEYDAILQKALRTSTDRAGEIWALT